MIAQQANKIAKPSPAHVAEPVSRLRRKCACGGHTLGGGECETCKAKRQDLQRKPERRSEVPDVPPIVHEVLRSPGQPLDAPTRALMEPHFGRGFSHMVSHALAPQAAPAALTVTLPNDRFEQEADHQARRIEQSAEAPLNQPFPRIGSYDFSHVRVHDDAQAAESAKRIDARAYTVGRDIVFGAGQYAPRTAAGRRLLAHELTHVVQQSSSGYGPAVQRDTFAGGPGKTALDKDRPLTAYAGPMPYTDKPGGTVIPNTAGTGQNCAGDSCSISKWINWPYLGYEVPKVTLPAGVQGDWAQATNFVPSGCTRVNCAGIDVWHTRCKESELELIAFLYKWPVMLNVNGTPMAGTQSDFHMIGRDATGLPKGWHSKMDRREKVADIRDPRQSLFDSYPHTKQKDRTIAQLCFCCGQSAIKTTKT